jgi:hypothetical protein
MTDPYQNIEQFDPDFRWSWREEQKAVRKVDLKIFSWVLVMFLSLSKCPPELTAIATTDW